MTATHHPRRHFNYSNVMSTLAVFLVIAGGSALAAALPKNSVKSNTVKDNQLKSQDLKDGKAVTGADVVDDSLTGNDVDESTLKGIGGAQGAQGPQGAIGPQGPPGPAGADGADGSLTGPAGGSLAGTYPNPTLAPNSVGANEIAANAVGGSEVNDGSINSVDVNDNSLTSDDVFTNALTGNDINESSLGQVPSALLGGFGRTGAEGSCDPESETFVTCAATEVLNVPAGARALILARVRGIPDGGDDHGVGECRLGTSSIGVVPNTTQLLATFVTNNGTETATLVGVTPPLPAGATSFGVDCNQTDGGIHYDDVSATVVLIAAN